MWLKEIFERAEIGQNLRGDALIVAERPPVVPSPFHGPTGRVAYRNTDDKSAILDDDQSVAEVEGQEV